MLLNLLVPASFGEPSPTRILLHENRGLRGFNIFQKNALLNETSFRTPFKFCAFHHAKSMTNCALGQRCLYMFLCCFWDAFSQPLAPLCLPFGFLWAPFCALGFLFPLFGFLLAPFGFHFGTVLGCVSASGLG